MRLLSDSHNLHGSYFWVWLKLTVGSTVIIWSLRSLRIVKLVLKTGREKFENRKRLGVIRGGFELRSEIFHQSLSFHRFQPFGSQDLSSRNFQNIQGLIEYSIKSWIFSKFFLDIPVRATSVVLWVYSDDFQNPEMLWPRCFQFAIQLLIGFTTSCRPRVRLIIYNWERLLLVISFDFVFI